MLDKEPLFPFWSPDGRAVGSGFQRRGPRPYILNRAGVVKADLGLRVQHLESVRIPRRAGKRNLLESSREAALVCSAEGIYWKRKDKDKAPSLTLLEAVGHRWCALRDLLVAEGCHGIYLYCAARGGGAGEGCDQA